MQERLRGLIAEIDTARPPLPAEEVDEAHAFLEWLLDNHITLLGYRDYDLVREGGEDVLRVVKGSGLGILRESEGTTVSTSFATLPPETRAQARKPELLVLSKANARATVHRPGYLDYVGVKRIDAEGRVTGERRILGLYTHTVYTANPRDIPVLRRKVAQVQARAGFLPASHDGKALASILEDYPRDELMQIEPDELYAHAIAILQLGERQRTRAAGAARRLRPLRHFSALRAARQVQHRNAPALPAHPGRGLRRHGERVQRQPVGIAAGAHLHGGAHPARRGAGGRRARARAPHRGRDAPLGGRAAGAAARARRRGARQPAVRALRPGLSRGLPRGPSGARRAARPRDDGRARRAAGAGR